VLVAQRAGGEPAEIVSRTIIVARGIQLVCFRAEAKNNIISDGSILMEPFDATGVRETLLDGFE